MLISICGNEKETFLEKQNLRDMAWEESYSDDFKAVKIRVSGLRGMKKKKKQKHMSLFIQRPFAASRFHFISCPMVWEKIL